MTGLIDSEVQALVELLQKGSKEYTEGRHISSDELKEKLRSKFTDVGGAVDECEL